MWFIYAVLRGLLASAHDPPVAWRLPTEELPGASGHLVTLPAHLPASPGASACAEELPRAVRVLGILHLSCTTA